MEDRYHVTLRPPLLAALDVWSEDDRDILYGFVVALRRFGFDVISSRSISPIPGLGVEYIEPGETPDMVWAIVFLDLTRTAIRLRVERHADGIILSGA